MIETLLELWCQIEIHKGKSSQFSLILTKNSIQQILKRGLYTIAGSVCELRSR